MPSLRRFLAALLAGAAAGCGDARVHVRSCTNFSDDTTVDGTTRSTTGRTVDGCDGTVIVIVHDAPAPGRAAFHLTITRLELESEGRIFIAFQGERRADLLAYRNQGFLLGRREDVPEVDFDTVRVRLADPAAEPAGARALTLAAGGEAVVALDEPLRVRAGRPLRLEIDIDVDSMLASAVEAGAGTVIAPVVRAAPALERELVPLAPLTGRVLRLEGGRLLVEADPAAGAYWTTVDTAAGTTGQGITRGDRLRIEGALEPDGVLRAASLAAEPR